MTKTKRQLRRGPEFDSQSGMSVILVITLMAALLALGAVGLNLQLASTKSAGLTKSSRQALYCAEAGLAKARNIVVANRDGWPAALAVDPDNPVGGPGWYPVTGDFDNDGVDDYQVFIKDDADGDGDPLADSNNTILVESICTKFSNAPASVIEVINLGASGHAYRNQSGQGEGNTGNAN